MKTIEKNNYPHTTILTILFTPPSHRSKEMSDRRSSEVFFQWAFALSPFPSYLPQYFSMIRQLSTAIGGDGGGSPSSSDSIDHFFNNGGVATHPLRKRTSMRAFVASAPVSPPAGAEGMMMPPGTPSKSFEGDVINGSNGEDGAHNKLDTGLSRATVLLLLSAHLLRLLYFHGVILSIEERLGEPALELDQLIASTGASAPSSQAAQTETLALQWDLLGQSTSMIVMQLMLLHTMMLLRRKYTTRPRDRMCGGSGNARLHHSADSLQSTPMVAEPPPRSGSFISSLQGMDICQGQSNISSRSNGNASLSFQTKWQRFYRATTVHLLHLFSPHAILQTHSFLEYLELLLVSSMTVKLVFDYHWYPRYGVHFVERLKQTSIVLESCLALPQAVRNHRKGTTEGLSVSK